MAIPEAQIKQVMDILTAWNPLGDRPDGIDDLNNYRAEAIDILFNMGLRDSKIPPVRIIREALNQAFDLSLSAQECTEAGGRILALTSDV